MKTRNIAGTTILALALAAPFGVMADKKDKMEGHIDALNLDAQRAEQVREIMSTYHDDKERIKSEKKARLEAVLSADEMKQLKEMKEEKKDKRQ